jgi:methionyl-tRNA formyltransferase
MKIIFFGDGKWASDSVEALQAAGRNIVGIVLRYRPSSPDLERAAKRFKLRVFQPEQVNTSAFYSELRALNPDLGISLSYNQILDCNLMKIFPNGIINFHAGKLPFYRGCNVINWAIINGEKELGLTAHFVDEGIDTGDIIIQKTFPIAWWDDYGVVLQNAVSMFPSFVVAAIELVRSGNVQRTKQSHLIGSYFCRRKDGDEWLNWNETSANIYNKIRAITRPGPGARTLCDDQVLLIWRSEYDPSWPSYLGNPGQVIGISEPGSFFVKTGDSVLQVHEAVFANSSKQRPVLKLGMRFISK